MSGLFERGLGQAWQLIISGDPYIWELTRVTLKVAAYSTVIAAVLGVPLGLLLGLGRFRGRQLLLVLANAGLGLPPVIVGVVLVVLLIPIGPLGGLHLLFTLRGVYVAQTVLAFPVIVALTASAVTGITPGLLDQARGFEARRFHIWILAAREARVGVTAAIVAALGGGLSEVGAVVLVGGNITFSTQTLASASLEYAGAADFPRALAIGIILLILVLIVIAAFTLLQYSGRRSNQAWRM